MTSKTTIEEYISSLPEPFLSIAKNLEQKISETLPYDAVMWHGHPVWMNGKNPVVGFKPYPRYVTLILWNGQKISGSPEVLLAGSRSMASIKIFDESSLSNETLKKWLLQLVSFESD